MYDLVSVNGGGVPTTTSLKVAEVFGKQHQHVMRAIRDLDVPEKFNASNFGRVEYSDQKGELRPMYEMTRDGFTILAMGFTGKKAMAWKIRYIEAFNSMEKALSSSIPEIKDQVADLRCRVSRLENRTPPRQMPLIPLPPAKETVSDEITAALMERGYANRSEWAKSFGFSPNHVKVVLWRIRKGKTPQRGKAREIVEKINETLGE